MSNNEEIAAELKNFANLNIIETIDNCKAMISSEESEGAQKKK